MTGAEQSPARKDAEAARHDEVVDLLTQIRDRLPEREQLDPSAPSVDVDGL